jgi:signal peptidase II
LAREGSALEARNALPSGAHGVGCDYALRRMSERSRKRRVWPRLGWFGAMAVAGGGCDLQTKAWAERTLADLPGQSMAVVDPWLELSLAYNKGTAFSFIPDLGDARWFFGVIALAVVVFLVVGVVRSYQDRLEVLALGVIAGGAIGNGVDRLLRLTPHGDTGVVDFIKVNYPWGGSWPTFNVADVLIAVGVAALLLAALRRRRDGEDTETAPPPTPSPA